MRRRSSGARARSLSIQTRLCWNWLKETSDCLKNEICICISEMEENSEGLLPSLLPQVGMEFSIIEEAWMFWISYGGQKGFEVRKRYINKRKSDGKKIRWEG